MKEGMAGEEGGSISIDTYARPPSCKLGLGSPSLIGLGNLTVCRGRLPRGCESVFSIYEEVKKFVCRGVGMRSRIVVAKSRSG